MPNDRNDSTAGENPVRAVDAFYELVTKGHEEKVVIIDTRLDVGDAVAIENEIWLVLREAEQAPTIGLARFVCSRALRLQAEAGELMDYATALGLDIIRARELRVSDDSGA
jgi:hypothetical protein